MSFAENIRTIRKEKGMSQEDLAEIMGVSRQAVSKWEQGEGYPEVEKLLLLANTWNLSLDQLLSEANTSIRDIPANSMSGVITVSSSKEHVIVPCRKILSSKKMKGGKNSPQYALFGVNKESASFWGDSTTFLGWYANEDLLSKEIQALQQAMTQGIPCYELQYNTAVEQKGLWISMVEDH